MNKNNLCARVLNYYRPGEIEPLNATKQVSCYLHGPDNTESARYYADTDSYYCFTCAAGGDAVWLVSQIEEISFHDAKRWLKERFGVEFEDREAVKDELKAYEKVIVQLVRETKPKKFLAIYKTLDKALESKDLEKLKFLFEGLKSRSLKNVGNDNRG